MNKKESPEKKEKKRQYILSAARSMFMEEGIDTVSMKEIAQKCLYGVATLYRWFSAKKYIVVGVGVQIWSEKKDKFLEIEKANQERKLNGYESFKNLMSYYESLFVSDPSFFIFLEDFDDYVLKEKMSEEELAPYNDVLMEIQSIFLGCAKQGVADGSVRKDIDFTMTYYSFAKALIGLAQKLILENNIVASDKAVVASKEIHTLIEVVTDFIEA